MHYQPQYPIDVTFLAMLAVYKGLEWLGFLMFEVVWALYHLTPDLLHL
jgi:hypothetical protein